MQKIKITYNKITKVIPITEKYDTELRVWNEFAEMATETMFSQIPSEYKKVAIIDLPKEIAENFFSVSEVEKQYFDYEERMILKLISEIESNFNTKICRDTFHWLSRCPNADEINDGVKHIFDCIDVVNDINFNKLII